MFNSLLRFFWPARRSRALRTLPDARRSHFFSWFNLQPDKEPTAADRDVYVSFRPSGEAFHALVRLGVRVRGADQIVGSELWVDRSFIEGMQSSFARDIVASYLSWALESDEAKAKDALIANIKNMSRANEPVIMRKNSIPQEPSADNTGGYGVFTGHSELATLALGESKLTLLNSTSDGGPQKWLTLKIAYASDKNWS